MDALTSVEVSVLGWPATWLAIWAMIVLAALVQSTTGFGMGLVSSPVLILIEPTLVPGVIIAMGVPVMLLVVGRERHALDLRPVAWAVAGRLPGAAVGAVAVVVLGTRQLALAFAAALLIAVAVSLAGFGIARTARNMIGVGFVSGVMGTATSIGSPPMALVYQHDQGPDLRTAIAAYMTGGAVFSLGLLAIFDQFGTRELIRAGAMVPPSILGFWASRWTVDILDRGRTRAAVLVFASAAAVVIGARTLV